MPITYLHVLFSSIAVPVKLQISLCIWLTCRTFVKPISMLSFGREWYPCHVWFETLFWTSLFTSFHRKLLFRILCYLQPYPSNSIFLLEHYYLGFCLLQPYASFSLLPFLLSMITTISVLRYLIFVCQPPKEEAISFWDYSNIPPAFGSMSWLGSTCGAIKMCLLNS